MTRGGNDRGADLPADDSDRRAAGERRERAERLTREVERLPQPYREVLMLYYYQPDGCTYRELAELLGVSAATVNARLTKARQAAQPDDVGVRIARRFGKRNGLTR